MNLHAYRALAVWLILTSSTAGASEVNPAVDYDGFLALGREAQVYRAERRLSEAEFARMAAEPGTVVLDTRSTTKFAELHLAGAVNLAFSDITRESLAQRIGPPETRVLIYCNNNFTGPQDAFPRKMAQAALNVPSFITLYAYGYRNLYELAPLIDPQDASLEFEGERVSPSPIR